MDFYSAWSSQEPNAIHGELIPKCTWSRSLLVYTCPYNSRSQGPAAYQLINVKKNRPCLCSPPLQEPLLRDVFRDAASLLLDEADLGRSSDAPWFLLFQLSESFRPSESADNVCVDFGGNRIRRRTNVSHSYEGRTQGEGQCRNQHTHACQVIYLKIINLIFFK